MSQDKFYAVCVDDEKDILDHYNSSIEDMGFEPKCFLSPDKALAFINEAADKIAIIISDYRMDPWNGLEFREKLMDDHKAIPFIIVSGFVTKEMALSAVNLKIAAFLGKPVSHSELAAVIAKETKDRVSVLEEKSVLSGVFIDECEEILEELEPLLMALESGIDNADTLNTIFRLVHTIKGSSGVLEMPDFTNFLHKYEDIFSMLKNAELRASAEVIDVLLKSLDVVNNVLSALKQGVAVNASYELYLNQFQAIVDGGSANSAVDQAADQETGNAPKGGGRGTPASKVEKVNVPTDLLDEFMAQLGEITVIRNMVNKTVKSIEKKIPRDEDVTFLGELLEEMHKINSLMQKQIVELRKIPIASILRRAPRTVRDLCRQLGKKARLEIIGEDLKVDTSIGQALTASLTHMVRNCLDHGLETPEVRQEAGKNPEGAIRIICREDGDRVSVLIKDDGRGINPENIKSKCLSQGMYTEAEIEAMPKDKLLSQIFEPGFSTAAQITDVSGRGVGMDMVKTSIEKLSGKIGIKSEVGLGTEFDLNIPIPKSVVIINSLLIKSNGFQFAIPQESISRLIQISKHNERIAIRNLESSLVLQIDDEVLPLVSLNGLTDGNRAILTNFELPEVPKIVLTKTENSHYGIVVDEILDAEDMVVKKLHKSVADLGIYAGSTFLGDGTVGLILDLDGIADQAGILLPAVDEFEDTSHPEELQNGDHTSTIANDYVIFSAGHPTPMAISIRHLFRLEEIKSSQIQISGDTATLIYRDRIIPVVDLDQCLGDHRVAYGELCSLIVVQYEERLFAFRIKEILDIHTIREDIDSSAKDNNLVEGSLRYKGKLVNLLNVRQVLESAGFEFKKEEPANVVSIAETPEPMEQASGDEGFGFF